MTLPLQIVLVVVLLAGLITIVMSSKNWHWTQLVLVLFIFFSSLGYLYLAAKVMKQHHALRAGIPQMEERLAGLTDQNEQLLHGGDGEEGILDFDHRLQLMARERGRVWRGVRPAGPIDQAGRVAIEISQLQPHGLQAKSIVFAMEAGPPHPADPMQGPQYLGEMRVVEVQPTGAVLEPVHLLDQYTGERLSQSEGPWTLYESMPVDRHDLFAEMTEEQLRKLLPESSIEAFLRHGTPATDDDDAWHRQGLDENDVPVGAENSDQAVKFVYNRSLEDFGYLFSELAEERVTAAAAASAVSEDNVKLEQALASAEQLSEFRTEQKELLGQHLAHMQEDREAIETHRDRVQQTLQTVKSWIERGLAENSTLARHLTEKQLGMLRQLDLTAPAPVGNPLTSQR